MSTVSYEDAPHYAACLMRDALIIGSRRMDVQAAFDPAVVQLEVSDYDVDSGFSVGNERWVELHPSGSPQFLHAMSSSSGRFAVMVGCVDYATGVSKIDWFEDTDGDDLVDNESRTTLMTEAASHLARSAYHEPSGTLFVLDGLNERILRLEDVDQDNRPDASSRTVFFANPVGQAGSFLPGKLTEAEARRVSVHLLVTADAVTGSLIMPRKGTMEDADTDGVAEIVQWTDSNGESIAPLMIGSLPVGGDEQIELLVTDSGDYRVLAAPSEGGAQVQLASENLDAGGHNVVLSRALVAGEIVLVEHVGASSRIMDRRKVRDPVDWVVGGWHNETSSVVAYGEAVTIVGDNFNGSEVVTAKLIDQPDSTAVGCVVTAWDSGSLTFNMPDFQEATLRRVLVKVARGTTNVALSLISGPQP